MTDTISNKQRVEWAAASLDHYGTTKEGRADYDAPEDMAADLICDLMHLIRGHGGEPLAKLDTAKMNFEAEELEAIQKAEDESTKRKRRTADVVVEVRGGVAEVTKQPEKMRVVVIDHDNS